MDCEIICNVDVPLAYVGLRILLIDPDPTSLSNIAAIVEEHSFKVTAIEQATVALSILRKHINQFDLIMVDANMLEMDYLEFVKSIQLIKEKTIIWICFIYENSLISSLKLKDIWKHVRWHDKKANEESQHYNAKQVNLMDNISCPTKMQDLKGKSKENCSTTYLDQEIDSLMEKDAAKRSKRMRSTNEETQVKHSVSSEKEEEHSFLPKISTERPEKERRNMKWTAELEKKLDEVVHELGDKAGPKNVLERMCVQDLTKECLTYRLKKYRSQKQQVSNVQPVTSTIFNEEHPSKVFNSSNSSTDVNELFQGAYRPQPLEVPLVTLPSSNHSSLIECDEWINEFLELDDFEPKLR
uniref:Response regulatory domain-containing protein n=1 Tax=Solanum lycopersicum TaxID=4081 RepID=K4B5C9_SOLLC